MKSIATMFVCWCALLISLQSSASAQTSPGGVNATAYLWPIPEGPPPLTTTSNCAGYANWLCVGLPLPGGGTGAVPYIAPTDFRRMLEQNGYRCFPAGYSIPQVGDIIHWKGIPSYALIGGMMVEQGRLQHFECVTAQQNSFCQGKWPGNIDYQISGLPGMAVGGSILSPYTRKYALCGAPYGGVLGSLDPILQGVYTEADICRKQ